MDDTTAQLGSFIYDAIAQTQVNIDGNRQIRGEWVEAGYPESFLAQVATSELTIVDTDGPVAVLALVVDGVRHRIEIIKED
jgi:hypothetical protein